MEVPAKLRVYPFQLIVQQQPTKTPHYYKTIKIKRKNTVADSLKHFGCQFDLQEAMLRRIIYK